MSSFNIHIRAYLSNESDHNSQKYFKGSNPIVRVESKNGDELVFDLVIGKAKIVSNDHEILKMLASKKWVPISIKKIQSSEDPMGFVPQEVVFIKINDVSKFPFISIKNVDRAIGSQQQFSTVASQVINSLTIDFQVFSEDLQTKKSATLKWSEPVSAAVVECADTLLRKISGKPFTIEEKNQLLKVRTAGSATIKVDPAKQHDWMSADAYITNKGVKRKDLTLADFCHINALLSGEDAAELKAGQWRTGPISLGGLGGPHYIGRDQQDVKELMRDFSSWLDRKIKKCEKNKDNPIVLAALAYQRMVSIHPFTDGNGRTARLVMDYILVRFDLPPASLGLDVSVAIFGDQNIIDVSAIESTPTKAVEKVIEGIKNTFKIIGTNF